MNAIQIIPLFLCAITSVASAQATSPLSPTELFRRASPSVVVVKAYDKKDKLLAFGSGVVIEDGVVVTNCHVLSTKGAEYPEVEYRGKNLGAVLREVDVERDICTLDVRGLSAMPALMGTSKALDIGDQVYAIGAPEGYKLTLSDGLVSGKRGTGGEELVQVTAPISHGSSGGGLFDSKGRLVGITTLMDTSGQALNFAIPAEWIADLPKRSTYSAKTAASTARTEAAAVAADAAYQARVAQTAADASAAQRSADAAAAAADAAASAAAAPPPRDRWWTFYEDDEIALAIDTKSVQSSDSKVVVWVRTLHATPQKSADGKPYVREVQIVTSYCGKRQISTGSAIWSAANGDNVWSYTPKSYEITTQNVVPDTKGEAIYEASCE